MDLPGTHAEMVIHISETRRSYLSLLHAINKKYILNRWKPIQVWDCPSGRSRRYISDFILNLNSKRPNPNWLLSHAKISNVCFDFALPPSRQRSFLSPYLEQVGDIRPPWRFQASIYLAPYRSLVKLVSFPLLCLSFSGWSNGDWHSWLGHSILNTSAFYSRTVSDASSRFPPSVDLPFISSLNSTLWKSQSKSLPLQPWNRSSSSSASATRRGSLMRPLESATEWAEDAQAFLLHVTSFDTADSQRKWPSCNYGKHDLVQLRLLLRRKQWKSITRNYAIVLQKMHAGNLVDFSKSLLHVAIQGQHKCFAHNLNLCDFQKIKGTFYLLAIITHLLSIDDFTLHKYSICRATYLNIYFSDQLSFQQTVL